VFKKGTKGISRAAERIWKFAKTSGHGVPVLRVFKKGTKGISRAAERIWKFAKTRDHGVPVSLKTSLLIEFMSMRTVIVALALTLTTVFPACALDKHDVEYGRADGIPLLLDLHVPDGPGPFPAAILVHGGGFDQGSKSTNVRPLFAPLADAGYAWFSIDYRLAPQAHFEQSIADVLVAVQWVRSHTYDYHLNLNEVVLIGESAGGLLANYAGTHIGNDQLAAVVDIYGPSDYANLALLRRDHPERFDMTSISRHAANGGGIHFFGVDQLDAAGIAKLHSISPMAGVHKGMPPFLCIHGTADDQVAF
jgi:alpha-L-fucosidase 2